MPEVSTMNAVESMLTRMQLQDAIPAFQAAGIDKVVTLRSLEPEKLKALVPDDEKRAKLEELIRRNERVAPPATIHGEQPPKYLDGNQGAAGGHRHQGKPGWKKDDEPRGAPRGRACRQFFTPEGCKFGDKCKYSHDAEVYNAEGGDNQRSHDALSREMHEEDVVVPWDSVKLLLGDRAKRLHQINVMCGTTNIKIQKPDDFATTYPIKFRGSKEGIAKAKMEIEKFVGITSQHEKEARFDYANHELEHNIKAVKQVCVCNMRNKGTRNEISETLLKRLVGTFRFTAPPKITHFWTLATIHDKERFEIVKEMVASMKGVQAILFTEPKRVIEMSKRAQQTAAAFGVQNPQFVHRDLKKEDRLAAFEAFKKGEVNSNGVVQRLLVTNNDYAKLARKILIPYVNFVIHFSLPASKELYLHQAMCCGRQGTEGISLLFLTPNDASIQKEWSQSLPLQEYFPGGKTPITNWTNKLRYDGPESLTSPEADPPENWRELLAKEQAEKAATKAAKQK